MSLALLRKVGGRRGTADCLEGLASVAGLEGRPERAARLFGATAALRQTILAPVPASARAAHEEQIDALRAALGNATFTAAWEAGHALTREQALLLALEEPGSAAG